MKVLVACEESQEVCKAFRAKGHEAYSCDLQECSGGHPEWHYTGDVLPLLNGNVTFLTDGGGTAVIDGKWDLMIAHPPCTYLCVTGNKWFDVEEYGDSARKRFVDRYAAIVFFMEIALANVPKIAVENPIGIMSTAWRKSDQIIQPYMFGDPFEKKTALWLKGLPPLKPTNIVEPPPRQVLSSGRTMPLWYSNCGGNRSKARSKTFPGIAKAMAEQWG